MKIPKRKSKKGVIEGAIKLLSDENHWGQGANAQDEHGNVIDVDHPKAVKFCLQGAIQVCSINDDSLINGILACMDDLSTKEHGVDIVSVNDIIGYEKVMELLHKSKKVCK